MFIFFWEGEGRVLLFSYRTALFFASRGQATRCWGDVGQFWSTLGFAAVCLFANWSGDGHIWGPCIPSANSLAGTIPEPRPHSPDAGLECRLSGVRTSVELLFGDIINYFKFLDFKKEL